MTTRRVQGGGRYLPMMCECTPASLALLDRFAGVAERLLSAPVLPVRAKGTLYSGEARLHRDSELDVAGIWFAAYLEPLDAATGALRVVPGRIRRRATRPTIRVPSTQSRPCPAT